VGHERLARGREPDPARAALHELRSGLALERRDLLAHGGLGEGQCLGGSRERALGGHLAEHSHAAYVEHHVYLYIILQTVI
jgi:hypothetical protein